MKLIVGLGNPGKQYEKTRHNIGFIVLDNFLKNLNKELFVQNRESKFHGFVSECLINNEKIFFLKPQTFMNNSGTSVNAISQFYKIPSKDILIIHDEIDFPLGKIQLKYGGSSAGHNGLKSIMQKLGTGDFRRLRIGIDRPQNKNQVADYVLSNFTANEKMLLENQKEEIEKLIYQFLKNQK